MSVDGVAPDGAPNGRPEVCCDNPEAEFVHEWGMDDGSTRAYVTTSDYVPPSPFARECRTRFGYGARRCACGVFGLRPLPLSAVRAKRAP